MKIISPAKINLTLDVSAKKDGDAFHPLETIMAKISLADTIIITPANEFSIQGPFNFKTEDNLIFKAWKLLQDQFGFALKPVHIEVQKMIPEGAGLGGGSSNFGTFIKGYCKLFGLPITQSIINKSAEYGKDIPFFMIPETIAQYTGFGEVLARTFAVSEFPNLKIHGHLFIPNFKHATPWAYQTLPEEAKGSTFTQQFLESKGEIIGNSFNAFKNISNYPDTIKKHFHITGSGSAAFCLGKSDIGIPFEVLKVLESS